MSIQSPRMLSYVVEQLVERLGHCRVEKTKKQTIKKISHERVTVLMILKIFLHLLVPFLIIFFFSFFKIPLIIVTTNFHHFLQSGTLLLFVIRNQVILIITCQFLNKWEIFSVYFYFCFKDMILCNIYNKQKEAKF